MPISDAKLNSSSPISSCDGAGPLRITQRRVTLPVMRRTQFALAIFAILACGLLFYSRGNRHSSKQPIEVASTTAQGVVDPKPEPATTVNSVPPPIVAAQDAGNATSPRVVDNESLIQRLHVLVATDPRLAEALARDDRLRVPSGPDAEERDMILVAAMHNQRETYVAKREAWYYYMHYPDGQFTEYLSNLTGLKPPAIRPSR